MGFDKDDIKRYKHKEKDCEEKKHDHKEKDCDEKKHDNKEKDCDEKKHNHKKKDYNKKSVYILYIILLIAFIVIAGLLIHFIIKDNKDNYKKVIYNPESIAEEINHAKTLSIDIPPNVYITQIYASIREKDCSDIDNGLIKIEDSEGSFFIHYFNKDSKSSVGEFEATLIKPLYVGPEGATITLRAFDENEYEKADVLAITVLYYTKTYAD